MRTSRVVVVGASLAGATAATALRELGFEGSVDVVGDEPQLPYERPGLSKAFLLTGDDGGSGLLVHPADHYARLDVRMHLGTSAVGLDTGRRVVRLAGGEELPYDEVVLATGSVNRRPDLPGLALAGVHQLRSLADAEELRAHAAVARAAVVVGQGFLGCEVASTLRQRGLDVTMVDPLPGPLFGPLGPEISERVAGWHRARGVRLRNGTGVTALTGGGSVEAVLLDDGSMLAADLVVVGVGARPATDWLTGSGLPTARGALLVDADGRSSVPGVLAAGDASAWADPVSGRHQHVEHYDAALAQAQRVAHTIVGVAAPVRPRSQFWTDQYDHVLQCTGDRQDGDELLWRASGTGFWLRGGTVSAVVSVDDGRAFRRALALVGSRPERAALLDDAVDLRTLRPGRREG